MNTSHRRKWLLGVAAASATFLPCAMISGAPGQDSARPVPVQTLTYRAAADGATAEEVRWGRGYYRGPYGYYGGYYGVPRYYSRYRGYYAPYGGSYGPRYYGPDFSGPGYGGYYYGGGGVRVGRFGVIWR